MPDLAALALSVPGLMVVNEKLHGRPADAGDQQSAMVCAHEVAPRGLASAADIDALPRLDPVTGEVNRATCLAMRPDPAAKEAAWATALSSGEPARIAQACAAGLWVPGQEELMAGYRDRYFAEALPALATRSPWAKRRLSRLLFPVTLVSKATIEAANAAEPSDNVLRLAVAEQATIMRRRLAARRRR